MLPLWIIDISYNQERKKQLLSRLDKMDHVFVPSKKEESPADDDESSAQIASRHDFEESGHKEKENRSKQDMADEAERKDAEKNAVIKGNYWYYSTFDDKISKKVKKDKDKQENEGRKENEEGNEDIIKNFGEEFYHFQEELVQEGQRFVHELRRSNVRPYQTINVIVLADSTEPFTQLVFASIAVILQKEKGRILPGHIHQGICIYGALFIPCNLNAREVQERKSVLHLLKELEVQHNLQNVRGYEHILLYQDVQNRTECTYGIMDEEKQAEYLLQCLIHLFYACDFTHPLISGTSSDDRFYFSMGAAAMYYDMTYEDDNEANKVAQTLVQQFKRERDDRRHNRVDLVFLDEKDYLVDKILRQLTNIENIDLSSAFSEDDCVLHPIRNSFHKYLKRKYYKTYLRFYPAALFRKINALIEEKTAALLDTISSGCSQAYKATESVFLPSIRNLLGKVQSMDGAMVTIELSLKMTQEIMSKQKSMIREYIEKMIWEKVTDDIPKNIRDYFDSYHDMYNEDAKHKNGGAGCAQMRQEAVKNLQGHLSQERTILSTIGRCFLLGMLCVLAILPILTFISPRIVNFGNVKDYVFLWALALFLFPLLVELFRLFSFWRKKNRYLRVLSAYYLHDAYARIANRIEYEAREYYDKVIALCEAYLNRNQCISKEILFPVPSVDTKLFIPDTMFNKPLIGKSFDDQEIISEDEVEKSRIKVNYEPCDISDLDDQRYYLLLNHYKDDFSILYRNVYVIENHVRRYDDENQQYKFIGKEELKKEAEETWQDNVKLFQANLLKDIRNDILPRECPTVGEKIRQCYLKSDRLDLLQPLIDFAAVNGEVISEFDTEYADVKINVDLPEELLQNRLPIQNTKIQVAKYVKLYGNYIFVTRWRCVDQLSLNRLFPFEDYDQSIREIVVFDEERKAKGKQKSSDQTTEQQTEDSKKSNTSVYEIDPSALFLWAVCPDDTSSQWLNLFDAQTFGDAYKDRNTIREIVNKED